MSLERNRRLLQYFALRVRGSHAGKVKRGVEEHRSVSGGKNEAVSIGPQWISRIVIQKIVPQLIHHGSETHRRTGMSRISLLHGVNGKSADGIDTELI